MRSGVGESTKQILDDAKLRWFGGRMKFLAEITPLEDKILDKVLENWWIVAVIAILLLVKIATLFKKK